jgi:hypothetical protein
MPTMTTSPCAYAELREGQLHEEMRVVSQMERVERELNQLRPELRRVRDLVKQAQRRREQEVAVEEPETEELKVDEPETEGAAELDADYLDERDDQAAKELDALVANELWLARAHASRTSRREKLQDEFGALVLRG